MAPKAFDRAVTTCRACRRRKVGCDRQRPSCRQCRSSGITCVYEVQGTRSYQFVQETPGGSSSQAPGAADVDEPEESVPVAVPEDRIAALESRVRSLSNLLSSLQQSSSVGTSPLRPASSGNETPPFTARAGYLSQQGGGKVRYVNASAWNAMCRDVSEIDEILFSQSADSVDDDAEATPSDVDVSQSAIAGAGTPTAMNPAIRTRSQSQMSSTLFASFWIDFPSKKFCDATLKWYFRGYHPLVPLVHVPSFRHEYEQFWDVLRNESQSRASFLPFTALILSFMYAGVIVGGQDQDLALPDLSVAETTSRLYRLTSRALKLARFPHAPTLDTLRAYMVQQAIRLKEEEPLDRLAFVGLGLRVANILGLHKDPRHFLQIDRIQGEVRRRVWWQLVHIDVCLAVAAGLPPLIDLQSWDVQPISELKDQLLDTVSGAEYEEDVREGRRMPDSADNPSDISAPSMVSAGGILAASKYRFTSVQRRFLLQLETGSPDAQARDILPRLHKLGEQLQQAIERIPDSTKDEIIQAGLDSASGSGLILNKWARLLLSTYYDQRLCLVSYAVSGVPDPQDLSGFHSQCIESAVSFLAKCARLSTEALYHRFHWSWPGNHQPLHALILLLNEILTVSNLPNADQIRHVVDVIFALASESSGLVGDVNNEGQTNTRVFNKGGSEVWKYLARLRARAWRKRNWDPANPLSRDHATAICQQWCANAEHGIEQVGTAQSVLSPGGYPPATTSEDITMPLMGFLGEDLLYSEDLELPNYASGAGLFEDVPGSWFEDL